MRGKSKHIIVLFSLLLFLWGIVKAYDIPSTNKRKVYSLNYDWKFIRSNPSDAETANFNDASWKNVSLPHTYNATDLYDTYVTGSGNYGWDGKTWYRKHFKLEQDYAESRVIIEFEKVRQAAEFYINGIWVGRHENGVAPCGIDISEHVNFGDSENVLAVMVDNTNSYNEKETGANFVWHTPPFLPNYGGIVNNVNLHITDKLYQTLPLYSNLGTSGTYVYAENINISGKSATITAETEIINSYTLAKNINYEVLIVDKDNNTIATKNAGDFTVNAGDTTRLSTQLNITDAKFWSPTYPYLYKVYTLIKIDGEVIDAYETPLGIREMAFNVNDGLLLNGKAIYLNGYAPRSTMEWVSVGIAPTWLEEYDFELMKQNNANFVRPMHVAPKTIDIEAADKYGFIYACPAGDAEGDNEGREWELRVELMRDVIIYFRNNPSVLFWEGGNQTISVEHMQDIKDVRDKWDPNGGRFVGTRSTQSELAEVMDYMCTMDNPATSATHPVWDAEWARAEAPRRIWDKYSPPFYGYDQVADPANEITEYPNQSFKLNSTEDLARDNIKRYNDRWSKRGGQGLSEIMVGGAKIIFAASTSHGRMIDTELARVTGVTDAARIPKSNFHALTVAHSDKPAIHILGHWNYPEQTVKNMFVIANTDEVELVVYDDNGNLIKNYGKGKQANNFEFSFTNVVWVKGKIVATGYNGGVKIVEHEIATVGEASKIVLTPTEGPDGFMADGSDIALFDVEVTDAQGNRCPTYHGKIDFTYSGEAQFLGGYNSGVEYSIFQDTLSVECGINRVFVRSTRTAGSFTINASAAGLADASATITSKAIQVEGGLSEKFSQNHIVALVEPALDQFVFTDVSDAEFDTDYISDAITISGSNAKLAIKIAYASSQASYSINDGAYKTEADSVSEGDKIKVKLKSASSYETTEYVRIDIGGISDDFSITTIETPSADENLALLKPAATEEGYETPAPYAVDGDLGTRWTRNGMPSSVTIDLLDEYTVGSGELVPFLNRDYQFIVEGSLDSINFFTMANMSDNMVGGELIDFECDAKKARYVRITFTGGYTYTGTWASMYEFRLYEKDMDIVPDQFTIKDTTGVEVFTEVISEPFIVTGIEGKASIRISESSESGAFSINKGIFTSDASTVENNDTVRVKLSSGSQYSNTHYARINIGGIWEDFKVTTKTLKVYDTIPNAFSFEPIYNAEPSIEYISNTIAVSGIDTLIPISIASETNAMYSINNAAFTNENAKVANNDSVRIKMLSSAMHSTKNEAVLSIGAVTSTFSVQTKNEPLVYDTIPDAFEFVNIENAALDTEILSGSIIVTGIDTLVPISISSDNEASFSINNEAYTKLNAQVKNNDTVRVKLHSSNDYNAETSAELTIGTISSYFVITTIAEPVVSISPNKQSNVFLYPNPAMKNVTVEVPESLIGTKLILYSPSGVVYIDIRLFSTHTTMNISQLKSDIYFISINNELQRKLIIE